MSSSASFEFTLNGHLVRVEGALVPMVGTLRFAMKWPRAPRHVEYAGQPITSHLAGARAQPR